MSLQEKMDRMAGLEEMGEQTETGNLRERMPAELSSQEKS